MEPEKEEPGQGLMAHIRNPNKRIYPMSELQVKAFWDNIFSANEPKRHIVIYTGFVGSIVWKLMRIGLSIDTTIPFWITNTKRVKNVFSYFSLFKKSGSVKLKVVYNGEEFLYECYRNTTFLFTFKDFSESIVKALKSINMEDETKKQYTDAELREMRQWVRENFVPGIDDVDPKWHKVMKDEARIMAQEQLREIDDIYLNRDE